MKKTLLACFFLIFIYTNCFAQTDVDYTNQFFVAKTARGRCYVFIYNDNFTFVNVIGNRPERVKYFLTWKE